jgi:hypothetical protein
LTQINSTINYQPQYNLEQIIADTIRHKKTGDE